MKKFLLCLFISFFIADGKAQFYTDTINFEKPDTLLKIDTSFAGNTWQIGKPQKTFFDSAFTKPNAIVTDTINFYPINNLSAFTVKIYDTSWSQFSSSGGMMIYFKHKFDTDSLLDGGYIEVSYDNGTSWTNIHNSGDFGNFPYSYWPGTSLANGTPAYTGKSRNDSGGWQWENVWWCYYGTWPIPNSIFLRFVFLSDNIQTNKQGWMIDDIYLDPIICEGIKENQNNNLISIFPNPVKDELFIKSSKSNFTGQIQIFDFSGRMIYENKNFIGKSISAKQFQNGIYSLKYSDGKNYSLKRFFVER